MYSKEEISFLLSSYKDAGIEETWSGHFLRSILENGSPRGRGIEVLESLLKKGPPTTWSQWSKVDEYLQAASCYSPENSDKKEILISFSNRIKNGYELTERQLSYGQVLIEESMQDPSWLPLDEEVTAYIDAVDSKFRSWSPFYIAQKQATSNKIERILKKFSQYNKISKGDFEYLQQTFKGLTATWSFAPQLYGKICKINKSCLSTKDYVTYPNGITINNPEQLDVVVMGGRHCYIGNVYVEVYVDGGLYYAQVDHLKLRKERSKKKNDENL